MTKEEVLQQCTVEDTVVKLPTLKLDRKLYQEVAKSLELIGGKWKSGKISGFVFQENPEELLKAISQGEKRNLKKEFQFFPTPPAVAERLVELAELKSGDMILEPSAGQGAIIKAIDRELSVLQQVNEKYNLGVTITNKVYAYELMPVNRVFLKKIENCELIGEDFLTEAGKTLYDKIIANPPFSKNQDIEHVLKMWECLKPGGMIVTIMSKHWQHCNFKKETAFRNWLTDVNADIHEIEAGAFKESGTIVGSCIVVIDKPKN
jgi:type I restriction-modification system DNA methylase subunit